jgi:hypothetical protein
MHSRISHRVHFFFVTWKMTTRNKVRSTKNTSQIRMKSELKSEEDSRSPLFSLNCPIRCGTSGYSYKRFVLIFYSFILLVFIYSVGIWDQIIKIIIQIKMNLVIIVLYVF